MNATIGYWVAIMVAAVKVKDWTEFNRAERALLALKRKAKVN